MTTTERNGKPACAVAKHRALKRFSDSRRERLGSRPEYGGALPRWAPNPVADRTIPRRRVLSPARRGRPVAAPDEPLRGGLDVGLCDCRRIGIGRRPDLGVGIGTRQFDPGPALLEQCPDLAEQRMIDPL